MKMMLELTKPTRLFLQAATAEDLMTRNPISIREDAPVKEAVGFLTGKGFSAAPVIDEGGRPVGVVSQTDIVIHDREAVQYLRPAVDFYEESDLTTEEQAPSWFGIESSDNTRVRDIMTQMVFSVRPDTSIEEVVQSMTGLKVHRIFVVDDAGVLIGVISALDILRHLEA